MGSDQAIQTKQSRQALTHNLMVPGEPEMRSKDQLQAIFDRRGIDVTFLQEDDLGSHWVSRSAANEVPTFAIYFYFDDINGKLEVERIVGVSQGTA